jgi:hypothetical protein
MPRPLCSRNGDKYSSWRRRALHQKVHAHGVDTVLVDKLFSGGEDFFVYHLASCSWLKGRTIVLPGQALILQSFDKSGVKI